MVDQEDIGLIQKLSLRVVAHRLLFHKPATTSRDTLQERDTWYIVLRDDHGVMGIGECSPIPGLSAEGTDEIDQALRALQSGIDMQSWMAHCSHISSVVMAIETALSDYRHGGRRLPFSSAKELNIPINGLVWMGEKKGMLSEALQKIEKGFNCIKLKIGSLDFNDDMDIIREIRAHYNAGRITIRVDANGAFDPSEALSKLEQLARYDIHSIEQPLRAGQWKAMKQLAENTPVPIALDEELIGITSEDMRNLLDDVMPQYLVLKPSLHGGFAHCDAWIRMAVERNISWWATSALESNIGLNAIAQWVNGYDNRVHQGLGTGSLYSNNIPSPIRIDNGMLKYDPKSGWDISSIFAAA
jgi:o-succinylbenzoate synthase